jgi:hypothetical protein
MPEPLDQPTAHPVDHSALDEAATRKLIDRRLRAAGGEANSEGLRYAKEARPSAGTFRAMVEWPTTNGQAGSARAGLCGCLSRMRGNSHVRF